MDNKILASGLAGLGLPAAGGVIETLERYIAAIEKWNPAWGLVGASGDELVIKHILDSLAPLSVIRGLIEKAGPGQGRPSLVDLGTGAGLPGIPLAITMPDIDVTLLDRMTRRIRFLEAMRTELPLANVEIVEEQVEHARGSFDIVTFRAFRPFERKLFKRVFAFCSAGGFVVAYKGKAERARAELAAIDGLYSSAEIIPIKVPFLDDERCVVVMSSGRLSAPRRSP